MKGAYSLRFSRSASTYDRWAVPQRESALELVNFVKPEGSVLDLGCGTGFVSSFLPEGCNPTGLDISEGMILKYRRDFPKGVLGDAEYLPFKDRSFDYVLSNFSLHWTDLGKSLPEALRIARVGVGVSLPIEGSLEGLGFPFPSEREVLEAVGSSSVEKFVKDIPVPFRGWELVRFFHYTGSSINPVRKRNLTKSEIENLINSIESYYFRMLFLYVGMK